MNHPRKEYTLHNDILYLITPNWGMAYWVYHGFTMGLPHEKWDDWMMILHGFQIEGFERGWVRTSLDFKL
jgi:hypothetical protein